MGVMGVRKLLLTMAAPMMLSMGVQALYHVVDMMFLARVSEYAVAAVTMSFPAHNLLIGISVGSAVGVNSLAARKFGEKNGAATGKIAAMGFLLCVFWGVFFLILSQSAVPWYFNFQTDNPIIVEYGTAYLSVTLANSAALLTGIMGERLLTSTGKASLAMAGLLVGAITNIILDPILIFGMFGLPAMGIAGAAYATVIAHWLSCGITLALNLKYNKEIKISLRDFAPDLKTIGGIYKIGFPTVVMGTVGSLAVFVINSILIGFSETAVAVFGVFFTLQSFIIMPVFGLINAMVPIVSYNYGAKSPERIISTIRLALIYAAALTLIGLLVFQIFPAQLLGMYDADANMIAIGVPALRRLSLNLIFASVSVILTSSMQALGEGLRSLCATLVRQLGAMIPSFWLLSLTGILSAVWWAFPIAELVCAIVTALLFMRVYRRKVIPLKASGEAV